MKRHGLTIVIAGLILIALLAACAIPPEELATPTPVPPDFYSRNALTIFARLPDAMLPEDHPVISQELIDLGRMLYYEERISISQEMSCNNCHLLDQYGVDGLQFSLGHDDNPVGRNAPTVYNAALHLAQFWDGRAADVEEQAQGPILAAGEMGMPNPEYVIQVLRSIPGYHDLFAAAFPDDADPITYDNVGAAIGAFERYLVTPDAFDALLAGNESALTAQQKRGVALFVSTGCTTCHYGAAIGGLRYAIMGQAEAYPNLADEGRFAITGVEADRYAFKVPGLRNIAMTGPYLHDGSVQTVEEVIDIMARYQLGRQLTTDQIADIAAFLDALTGQIPTNYIVVPEFPESGPDTPGPYSEEAEAAVEAGS